MPALQTRFYCKGFRRTSGDAYCARRPRGNARDSQRGQGWHRCRWTTRYRLWNHPGRHRGSRQRRDRHQADRQCRHANYFDQVQDAVVDQAGPVWRQVSSSSFVENSVFISNLNQIYGPSHPWPQVHPTRQTARRCYLLSTIICWQIRRHPRAPVPQPRMPTKVYHPALRQRDSRRRGGPSSTSTRRALRAPTAKEYRSRWSSETQLATTQLDTNTMEIKASAF